MRDRCLALLTVAALAVVVGAAPAGAASSDRTDALTRYGVLEIERVRNESGHRLPRQVADGIRQTLAARLAQRRPDVGGATDVATLRTSILAYGAAGAAPSAIGQQTIVKAVLFDQQRQRRLIEFVVVGPAQTARPAGSLPARPDATITTLAEAIASQLAGAAERGSAGREPRDRFAVGSAPFAHVGDGVFVADEAGATPGPTAVLNLKQIRHGHDPVADADVLPFTNVTLNDRVPPLADDQGRQYALITLYNVDPPLDGLPSAEPGIDRGTDFRDPANLIKGTYSSYVSPVFTLTDRQHPVPGHPIGHFLVKVQIPGYPTILTGMTTTVRADDELVDLTLGRQLGVGGVLLTPQPGRLNSAAEALEELSRRQNALIVTDGRYYRNVGGRNVGPTYVIDDGNVTFARFKVPTENAKDALRFFLEYVHRGVQDTFGSLLNRPHKGTGAGCAAFAFAWLKAAGVIPFVDEAAFDGALGDVDPDASASAVWAESYRRIRIPWPHIGCDDRLGLQQTLPADYTIYDLLFYRESRDTLVEASQGLAAMIQQDVGVLGATLFQFGAFTPLRDIVIRSRRKDPNDLGDYAWAPAGSGLEIGFWDNRLFSNWVKARWQRGTNSAEIRLVREGRFYGAEIDAMKTPRQAAAFFRRADRIAERRARLRADGVVPTSCEAALALGLQ